MAQNFHSLPSQVLLLKAGSELTPCCSAATPSSSASHATAASYSTFSSQGLKDNLCSHKRVVDSEVCVLHFEGCVEIRYSTVCRVLRVLCIDLCHPLLVLL